ncbi:hypothetical protein ACV0UQ_002788 [Vibrio vulnificus]
MNTPEKNLSELKLDGLFEFMGVKHPVFASEDGKFILAKNLCEQIGIQWHRQRSKLQSDESIGLFGTCIFTNGTPRCSETAESEGGNADLDAKNRHIISPKEGLYIKLSRTQMYLARLSTTQVLNQGNKSAAEFIYSMQIEWAEALYSYEFNGIAVKQSLQKQEKERVDLLTKLQKLKKDSQDPKIRAIADYHLDQILNELGLPVEEKKQA